MRFKLPGSRFLFSAESVGVLVLLFVHVVLTHVLATVGASVEIYYAYRISILSGSRIPLVIISAVRASVNRSCLHILRPWPTCRSL